MGIRYHKGVVIMENQIYWILVGTRPEVIKQVPLYFELVRRFGKEKVALVGTGQHKELLEQALSHFGVHLDFNLNIMKPNQTLSSSSAAVLEGLDELFLKSKPEWLIVQGDTTSAAMAAWAAFQSGVMVAHNEAGLRSYDLDHPFPEEGNRRHIAIVAKAHFAPTEMARQALLNEGVPAQNIFLTGNTGIDALKWTLEQHAPESISQLLKVVKDAGQKPVLLTAHRRENKAAMDAWFETLAKFIVSNPELSLIYPIHPNHTAKPAAEKHLSHLKQVHMIPAIHYGETCHLLSECEFVITDSGGIQEEASTLGLPVVICRKTTERMEAVNEGVARLAGTDPDSIRKSMQWAKNLGRPEKRGIQRNIFGDGFAAQRIADQL